ncbi:MAG: hypothetical protein HFH62_03715 [Lachnospiraceae bacterium]|nr:hypothetical protein [Lachnospiraceae bacterium]
MMEYLPGMQPQSEKRNVFSLQFSVKAMLFYNGRIDIFPVGAPQALRYGARFYKTVE